MNVHEGTQRLRVGAVNYLNTKPLIYGFGKGMMKDEVELVMDTPGNIAVALLNNQIDIGLVPVAIIPQLNEYSIVGDYCIAADGEVASVCLFSEVPVNEITTVLLDYQSRTSVLLVQYLFSEYWKLSPRFEAAEPGFIQQVNGTTAAVIIGDRAFVQRKKTPFVYDLSAVWKQHTGLPFVFAAWISKKPVDAGFARDFNAANQYGIDRLEEVIMQNHYDEYDLRHYYTVNIHYKLNQDMLKGLHYFLSWCKTYLGEIPALVDG